MFNIEELELWLHKEMGSKILTMLNTFTIFAY